MNTKYYDKEKSREAAKRYREKDIEANRAYQRARRARDPEKHREYRRRYYQENKDRILKLANEWRRKNREPDLAAKRRRRANLQNAESAPYTIDEVLQTYGLICYLCGKEIDLDAPRWTAQQGWENGLHLDHVIPIREKGPDTLENVRPTHGRCNLKKH